MSSSFTKLKFLASLLLVVVLFGAVSLPNRAYAQLNDDPAESGNEEHVAGAKPPKGTVQPSPFVCIESTMKVPTGLNILGCFSNVIFITMNVFATLLTIVGIFLDTAINYSIMGMSLFVNNIPGITVAWTVLRDLSNILILFVLLFAAVGIILRTDKIVPKSVLAKVIIAAFLINFSMFFTKVIIDIGNVATAQIYKEATTGQIVPSIGLQLATSLNPMSAYIEATINPEVKAGNFETHIFQQMLFSTILLMISTFALFVAAIMLFHRFFTLIILIVTSPIGVVGLLIPKLKGRAGDWWSTLFGQVFFAPIFLLFLLIALRILNNGEFKQGLVSAGVIDGIPNVFDFTGGLIGMIQYAFVISIILTGLGVAKSIAGKTSIGITKWASEKAGSIAFGGAALAGSYGIGRLGKGLAESQFANELQGSNSVAARMVGRGLINSGNYLGNASFDIRGTKLGKELGAGNAAPGFFKREKEEQKRIEEARKKIQPKETTGNMLPTLQRERDAILGNYGRQIEVNKKFRELEALRAAEQGLTGNKLAEARAKTKLAESRISADDRLVRLTTSTTTLAAQEKRIAELDKKLGEVEKLSATTQKEKKGQAESDIARLANVLETHEVQQAREVAKAIEKITDKGQREQKLSTLSTQQRDYVDALNKLALASKQLGDLQKSTQIQWADQNIQKSGPVGGAAEAIRKEHGKTKASKILEDLIKEESKPEPEPAPTAPAPSEPPQTT